MRYTVVIKAENDMYIVPVRIQSVAISDNLAKIRSSHLYFASKESRFADYQTAQLF